jgi:CRISPR-associated endonuclease Cas2
MFFKLIGRHWIKGGFINLRSKLARIILAKGLDRINKSVYLGEIKQEEADKLNQAIRQLIKADGEPQDSCIIIGVNPQQVQDMMVIGDNQLDKDELSGQKTTIII